MHKCIIPPLWPTRSLHWLVIRPVKVQANYKSCAKCARVTFFTHTLLACLTPTPSLSLHMHITCVCLTVEQAKNFKCIRVNVCDMYPFSLLSLVMCSTSILVVNFFIFFSLTFLQDGGTPLYMASQNGHTSVVDILLRHGADPNIATTVSVEISSTSYHHVSLTECMWR